MKFPRFTLCSMPELFSVAYIWVILIHLSWLCVNNFWCKTQGNNSFAHCTVFMILLHLLYFIMSVVTSSTKFRLSSSSAMCECFHLTMLSITSSWYSLSFTDITFFYFFLYFMAVQSFYTLTFFKIHDRMNFLGFKYPG